MLSGEIPKPSELSAAEKKRFEMAVAIAYNAEILINAICAIKQEELETYYDANDASPFSAFHRHLRYLRESKDPEAERLRAQEGFIAEASRLYLIKTLEQIFESISSPVSTRVEVDILPNKDSVNITEIVKDYIFSGSRKDLVNAVSQALSLATDRLVNLLDVQIEDKDFYTQDEIETLGIERYVNKFGGYDYLFNTALPGVYWSLRYDGKSNLPFCAVFVDPVS